MTRRAARNRREPPPPAQLLRAKIERLAGSQERSIVKLIVTRGPTIVRGYAVSGSEQATRLSIRYPWPVEDPIPWQQGVSVRIAAVRLGENPALAGLKHCNRLEQILARRLQGLLQPLLEEPADG